MLDKKGKTGKPDPVRRVALDGVCMAMYMVLAFLSISIGNVKLVLTSVVVLLVGCLYGPLDAVIVAAGGEFLNQVIRYGVTATTPLWVLPPALRGLIVGVAALILFRLKGRFMEKTPVLFFTVGIAAAPIVTMVNTLIIYLDAKIFNYYTSAYVWGQFGWRMLTGVVTAALVCLLCLFILPPMRKEGIGRFVKPREEEESEDGRTKDGLRDDWDL